jgi:hypothetical protein
VHVLYGVRSTFKGPLPCTEYLRDRYLYTYKGIGKLPYFRYLRKPSSLTFVEDYVGGALIP